MPFEAYKVYQEYEPDKYKTSVQKRVAQVLGSAEQQGLGKTPEALDFHEAKEIFGKDFLGPEAIKKAFGIELTSEELNEVENIPYTREELEKAKELGMMLVLRVPHDKDNQALTIKRARDMFKGGDALGAPDRKKSRVMWNQDWYDSEDFALTQIPKLGWGLVMKEVLPESLSKNWEQQEEVLKRWAEQNDIDPATVRRRTPIEVVYDTILYYGENQQSLLETKWDWTGVQSSDGLLVNVGPFDSDGLYVRLALREISHSDLGVCPAR